MNKKGYTVKDLLPLGVLLVVTTIAVSIGASILTDVNTGFLSGAANCNSTSTTACGYAFNATDEGLQGVDELGSWFGTIGLVLAASVVIGILVMSFAFRN